MKELRPYQNLAIDKVAYKVGEGKKRIIFQLATGGGKTVTFAGLANRFLNRNQKKIVILVHREELLKQACRTLWEWYELVAAPVMAGNTYLPNRMAYAAMVETAYNRLKKNPNYFGNVGLVIVDECHIGNFKKLYDLFPNAIIIGFTATPISGSKKDPLKNYFEDIVCGIDIPELIQQGSLVKNKTIHIVNVKRSELKLKNGEFDETVMGNVYSSAKHVMNTIASYRAYSEGKKAIIFNCNIDHSKKVNDAFNSFGFPSRHLDGETPAHERAAILKWFKDTPNAVLNNVGILTTGFDEPSVQTVIINKSTMSLPLWLQMTGRGSRPFPGKDFFTIIDMGGNAITMGDWCAPRDWNHTFFNPAKPKEGGEAPSKACVKCRTVIHASIKICPHCGALNQKKASYDEMPVSFELLVRDRPFHIDVKKMLKDNSQYKDYYTLFQLRRNMIMHIKKVWRLKFLDESSVHKIRMQHQEYVKQWCEATGKKYDNWHKNKTDDGLMEDLKKVFKYGVQ